jgi:hypothetical protein
MPALLLYQHIGDLRAPNRLVESPLPRGLMPRFQKNAIAIVVKPVE